MRDLPAELPADLPVWERSAVRVVVVDAAGRVLLFHTRDVDHPDLGMWWELPGGGLDTGEDFREAAVRELREEAGLHIAPAAVGPPTWRRLASFRHRQRRHLQDEVVVSVRLDRPGPDVDGSQRLDYEHEDYVGFRWWAVADIVASSEHFYPSRLPSLIETFLAGVAIDEPFDLFS